MTSRSSLHLVLKHRQDAAKPEQTQRLEVTSCGGVGHDPGETCEGAAPWQLVHHLPGIALQLVRCPQEPSHHHLLLPSWKPHPECTAFGYEDDTSPRLIDPIAHMLRASSISSQRHRPQLGSQVIASVASIHSPQPLRSLNRLGKMLASVCASS